MMIISKKAMIKKPKLYLNFPHMIEFVLLDLNYFYASSFVLLSTSSSSAPLPVSIARTFSFRSHPLTMHNVLFCLDVLLNSYIVPTY